VLSGSILQLNLSPGGLPKRPVREAFLTPLGFEGDLHAHPHIHGGPGRAVLLVAAEATGDLIARGFPLFYGALGENLTTRGLDFRALRPGMRLRCGEAEIELVKLRKPCVQLDVYGEELKAVIGADPPLGGYYASVLRVGMVRVDDEIVVESVSV
jgi:MOSC domain-containing protein YiiM